MAVVILGGARGVIYTIYRYGVIVERPLSKKCIIKGLTVKVKGPRKTKHR